MEYLKVEHRVATYNTLLKRSIIIYTTHEISWEYIIHVHVIRKFLVVVPLC